MHVTLIHNPGAGDEQHSGDALLQVLHEAGHEALYQSSKADGWEGALEDPGDMVAVAGGDGTVGKVAKQLLGRHVPIAILPLGTANNISKSLGLTDIPLPQLVDGWATARRVKFDVGVADFSTESSYFIEGLGTGLFAGTMSRLDDEDNIELAHAGDAEEKITSVLRLLRERLRSYPAKDLKVTLDGEDLSGEYVLVEALNIKYVGPNLHLAPEADPGDGLLDVVLLRGDERDEMSRYLDERLAGGLRPPRLAVRRVKHLQIEWSGFAIHVDDEIWPDDSGVPDAPTIIDVKVDHHAIEFLIPARR
jgi:diacylglycerol kinase family enzyme